jgi:hypothetical protein
MKESHKIKISIFIFAIIIFCISFFTGESINDNLFRWISGASSTVVIIWAIYEKWIWKWSIFSKLSMFMDNPILHGTWKGTLNYEKNAYGKAGKVKIYLSVHQTLTTIAVRAFFKKPSESNSIVAKIEKLKPSRKQLLYLYKSEAPHSKRKNNPPHDGAVVLNIIGMPVRELSGSYFTDRTGAGIVKLTKHNSSLAESFEDAEKLNYS